MRSSPKCATCGGLIAEGQETVPGLVSLHADYQDCQAELRRPSWRSAAVRHFRIRQRGGVVPKHGSMSQQEMQDRD